MSEAVNKAQRIEDLTGEIREIMDEGFYPENYHKFSRKIENRLSEIEELSNDLYRLLRNVGMMGDD